MVDILGLATALRAATTIIKIVFVFVSSTWAHHQTTFCILVRNSKEADGNSLGKDALFCSDDGKHSNSFAASYIEKMLRK